MAVGARRFVDRTPRKAALRPLPKPFRLLSFRGTNTVPWIGNSVPSLAREDSSFLPEELVRFRDLLREDTITCWTQSEVEHPIHFFEQYVQCHHCGAQRFRITTASKCCRNGSLILNDVQRLPEDLLDLMTGTSALWSHGVSKESRVLNNSYRFGQQVLPRIGGEVQSHMSDAYQHLRITGIPYTIVPNLNASSALRSYIDDPEARMALVSSFSGVVRPTSVLVSEIERIIERECPLVDALVNFATEGAEGHLVLRYEGPTHSLRAFTSTTASSLTDGRHVCFTTQQSGENTKVYSSHPLYPAMNWPLLFPRARPLAYGKDGSALLYNFVRDDDDDVLAQLTGEGASRSRATCWTINQMALAMLYQPERRADQPDGEATFATAGTASPYETNELIQRRFSKLELCGRLGDEVLLEMFLAAEDERLRYLALPYVQARITGQFGAETTADEDDVAKGTYLPPSVQGSDRHMRESIANALTAVSQDGDPVLFITMTVDTKTWQEELTRLPVFDGKQQDLFDRAGLSSEVFKGKLEALLARLRSGTIFRNVGRPEPSERANDANMFRPPPDDRHFRNKAKEWAAEQQAWLKAFKAAFEWEPGERDDDESEFDAARKAFVGYQCELKFPLETKERGYIVYSIEYQSRGLVHVHIVWRPSDPSAIPGYDGDAVPGTQVPWVDELVCARLPSDEVLRDFKLVGTVADMRSLVTDVHGCVDPAYAPLFDGCADDELVPHPDLFHDFGFATPREVLDELACLTVGVKGLELDDDGEHWSCKPNAPRHKVAGAKMIHYHKHIDVPEDWCRKPSTGECKGVQGVSFPAPIAAASFITGERKLNYRRGPNDRMVVPYNPWLLLYFRSHINVQVSSTTNVIYYLFKYLMKGNDKNRGQVVIGTERPRGTQAPAGASSTHNRREPKNEIALWRNLKERCAPEAFWRVNEYTSYHMEPSCEKLVVHVERERRDDDIGFSELEKYYAAMEQLWQPDSLFVSTFGNERPLFLDFYRRFKVVTRSSKPKAAQHRQKSDGIAAYCLADGRNVYEICCSDDRCDGGYEAVYYCYKYEAGDRRYTRMARVPHTAGHAHYARMLLRRRAAWSHESVRTVADDHGVDVLHPTCEAACRALGLLADEREAEELLTESIAELDPPPTVRSLFARLTLDGYAMTALLASTNQITTLHGVPHTIFTYMALDFARTHVTAAEQRNHCLAELDAHLVLHGKCMADFFPAEWCPRETSRELERHKLAYDAAEQRAVAAKHPLDSKGGSEQTRVLNWCLSGEPACAKRRKANRIEVAVMTGDGGAGKSWTIKRALAEVHASGGVALVSAATAKAATFFRDGHTLHELGGIPIDTDADGHTLIRMKREGGSLTEQRLELLVAADLIVIDEVSSLNRRFIEAFLDMLRTKGSCARVLLVGDFQQIPPVVKSSARVQVFEASLRSSHEYADAAKFELAVQYRAAEDPEYAASVRAFGDGSLDAIKGHSGNDAERGVRVVEMPLITTLFHEDDEEYDNAAIEWLYGVDDRGRLDVQSGTKAILCATNTLRNKWNDVVSRRLAADAGHDDSASVVRTYDAFHKADIDAGADLDDAMQSTLLAALGDDEMERLNHDHSAPGASLTLRKGDNVLLMANLDKKAGLVNNAALRVVHLRPNSVVCEMDHGAGVATRHVIYRRPFKIKLPGDTPVYVLRRQIPLVQSYAMTINKAQGMTLDQVLFDARRAPFQHGHAYVLFSRVRNRHSVGAVVDDDTRRAHGRGYHLVTTTVLYEELISDDELCARCDEDSNDSEHASDTGGDDDNDGADENADGADVMDVDRPLDDTPTTRATRDAIERALGAIFAGRRAECSLDALMCALRSSGGAPSRAQVVPLLHAMDREDNGSILFREGRIHLI